MATSQGAMSVSQILAMSGIDHAYKMELLQKELFRRSLDQCAVFNPLGEDIVLRWDGRPHRFIGKHKDDGYGAGVTVIDRFLCMHYMKHAVNLLIGKRNDERVAARNAERAKQGLDPMDGEQRLLFDLRIDDEEQRRPHWDPQDDRAPTLWLGIVKEYAMDDEEMTTEEERFIQDGRPLDIQLAEQFQDRRANISSVPSNARNLSPTLDGPNMNIEGKTYEEATNLGDPDTDKNTTPPSQRFKNKTDIINRAQKA